MIESLFKNTLISKSFGYQAASTTDIVTATEIDMASSTEGCYDSVCFIATFDTVTTAAVCTLKAYAGTVAGLASLAAYATTTATVTASGTDTNNNQLILDCVNIGKRYVRPDLIIDTANAAVSSIIAIRYNTRSLPTPELSGLADGAVSISMA